MFTLVRNAHEIRVTAQIARTVFCTSKRAMRREGTAAPKTGKGNERS